MGMFDNIDRAFAPFFDSVVSIRRRSGSDDVAVGTLHALVLDQGVDDPLSEDSEESVRGALSVTVGVLECDAFGYVPRIGDTVVTDDERVYAVMGVSKKDGLYDLSVRAK